MKLSKNVKAWLVKNADAQSTWTDDNLFAEAATSALEAGTLTPTKFAELNGPSPDDVFGQPRVKKPSERYSSKKTAAKHVRTGEHVRDEKGKQVETISELEHAKIGAFLKHRAAKDGQQTLLTEHDRQLVGELFESEKWCGNLGGEWKTGIDGMRVKALLDDVTSGGAEVVPQFFDSAVIQFPLLHSELLPRIDLRDVPRGSSVEGASIANPTANWGTSEGTSMSPFDTASIVSQIATSIHPVTVALEIGRDFLSDAAVDVGRILIENIGQKMLEELDKVIVVGNGTTQPEGIFNASGIIDIGNPAGGAGAAPQVDDYESLVFSVGKQYRGSVMRPAFFNDTSYSRARGIPVGSADTRRVFGMDQQSYRLFENPFLIQNSIANSFAGYGALAKYRLYRRQAQEVRFTSEGKELALKNMTLLIVRGRFGGKVVDPNAFAFSNNWQA
ncbi:MAG: phage major capsid protein [Planctomycetes bacterium]|nr:phage major capsid protein [Planctomycetota bacterium]